MRSIPKKAWPGLIQFAPDRFPTLLSQFGSLEPGSKERQIVGEELDCLTGQFRSWAVDFVRRKEEAELLLLAKRVQRERQMDGEFWNKHFDTLAAADLTPIEEKRLAKLVVLRTNRIAKPIKAAVDALEKAKRVRR